MKTERKPERRSLPTPGDRRSKNEETTPAPQLDEDWDEPVVAGTRPGQHELAEEGKE